MMTDVNTTKKRRYTVDFVQFDTHTKGKHIMRWEMQCRLIQFYRGETRCTHCQEISYKQGKCKCTDHLRFHSKLIEPYFYFYTFYYAEAPGLRHFLETRFRIRWKPSLNGYI